MVAATADARDIVRKARAHSPDVAVVDIQMPPGFGDDGLRAAREIHEIEPAIGVLVLSQFLEESYAADLLGDRPEGVGYLLKDRIADAGSLAEAVRRVARGGSVIDPDVIRCLVGRRRTPDPPRRADPSRAGGARADGGRGVKRGSPTRLWSRSRRWSVM